MGGFLPVNTWKMFKHILLGAALPVIESSETRYSCTCVGFASDRDMRSAAELACAAERMRVSASETLERLEKMQARAAPALAARERRGSITSTYGPKPTTAPSRPNTTSPISASAPLRPAERATQSARRAARLQGQRRGCADGCRRCAGPGAGGGAGRRRRGERAVRGTERDDLLVNSSHARGRVTTLPKAGVLKL